MLKKLCVLSLIAAGVAYGSQNVELGNSVIYSTTGFEESVRDVASSPVVVTAKEIEEKHYKTVEEVLRDIPAVNINYQMGMPIIDMRAQGENAKNNVQILIDGVPANSLDTSMISSAINTVPVDNIERIEVIPGGGAVLYGSGTSGGVVNIITKKRKGPRYGVGYDFGNYNGNKFDLSAGYTFGKLDVDLAYTKNNIKGYRKYNEDKSDFFQGKLNYQISDTQSIGLKYEKFDNEMEIPGSLSESEIKDDRRQSGLFPDEKYTLSTDKDAYTIDYRNKVTDNLELSLLGFVQTTKITFKNSYAIPDESFDMIAHFDDDKKGIKGKLKRSYGEGSSLVFGVDYINNKLTRTMNQAIKSRDVEIMTPRVSVITDMEIGTMNDINLRKKTLSAFLLNTYKHNSLEFIQGIRYEIANYDLERLALATTNGTVWMSAPTIPPMDGMVMAHISPTPVPHYLNHKVKEDNFAAELALNWLYSDTGNAYIKYERGFTSPAPALLTNRDGVTGEYYLNDLKSETFNSIEIGIKDYVGSTYLGATAYYTVTKDEIRSSAHTAGMSEIIIINLDKTERFGLELFAEQHLNKFTFKESYSYVNAKVKRGFDRGFNLAGNKIALVPEHKFALGASYRITSKLSLGADIIYNSAAYLNNQNEGGKKNAHVVANARINYEPVKGLNIHAGVNNIFDKKYYDVVSYDSSNGYSYDPAYARSYYVGFKYQF
ncbi:MAG: TonB-dependent receptor [Fusobacteriaceae bacterium]|jgi:iron complex outermembrane receptor protein|nr:TonB-dependent receptor [Fusobacteriaceae bacterium]